MEGEGLSETEEGGETAEDAGKEVIVKEVVEIVGEVEAEVAIVDVVVARNSAQESLSHFLLVKDVAILQWATFAAILIILTTCK